MTVPTTRDQFKQFCMRRLGWPVIQLNLDPDQIDDCIDIALQYFYDYHFDGTQKVYYKYQVTSEDIANEYITLPENIIGAVEIWPIAQAVSTNNMFNIRYQIALNDLYTLTSVSMVPYYMALNHIQFLEKLLVGQQPIRYNRINNICYVDMDWSSVNVADYVIITAYQVIDPAVYPNIWKEFWLQKYTACLLKQQWGTNLKKFEGMTLPGGLKFNGQKIYDEATQERELLEHEMIHTMSLPSVDMIN